MSEFDKASAHARVNITTRCRNLTDVMSGNACAENLFRSCAHCNGCNVNIDHEVVNTNKIEKWCKLRLQRLDTRPRKTESRLELARREIQLIAGER